MSDTPRTDTDRDGFMAALVEHANGIGQVTLRRVHEVFDQWLAAHDAEVRSQALADVLALADDLEREGLPGTANRLRAAVDAADPTAHDRAEIKYPSPAAAGFSGQWIMSKEFKDSQHKMLNAAKERGWDEGKAAGFSVAMRRMSDEPNAPEPVNPYRADTIEADQ